MLKEEEEEERRIEYGLSLLFQDRISFRTCFAMYEVSSAILGPGGRCHTAAVFPKCGAAKCAREAFFLFFICGAADRSRHGKCSSYSSSCCCGDTFHFY